MAEVLNPDKWFHRLRGRSRLILGNCPRCNSDAPEVYFCAVCKEVHIDGQNTTERNVRQQYPPIRATKALWWWVWMHPGFNDLQVYWRQFIER